MFEDSRKKKCFLEAENSQVGFTLVEVLIGVSLMLAGALTLAEILVSQTKWLKANRAVSVRDALLSSVQRFGADARALNNSMKQAISNNALIRDCVEQTGNCGDSGEADPNTPANFVLYSSNGTVPITGFYDINNLRCAPNEFLGPLSEACPFQVVTQFIAHCPGGAQRCPRAQTIEVLYTITTHSSIKPPLRKISNIGSPPPLVTSYLAILGAFDTGRALALAKYDSLGQLSFATARGSLRRIAKCLNEQERVDLFIPFEPGSWDLKGDRSAPTQNLGLAVQRSGRTPERHSDTWKRS